MSTSESVFCHQTALFFDECRTFLKESPKTMEELRLKHRLMRTLLLMKQGAETLGFPGSDGPGRWIMEMRDRGVPVPVFEQSITESYLDGLGQASIALCGILKTEAKKRDDGQRIFLKRAICDRLIEYPKATTLQLINWLDSANAVEVPTTWRNGGDKSFAAAYRDPKLRHRIEIFVSRARKSNLPQP